MRNLVVLFIHFIAIVARLLGPGGVGSLVAESLLLMHQPPDRESLQATIAQSTGVGPHPRRLDGALSASNSSAPIRNRTEALDTARPSQSHEQAKVSHAVLPGSPSEARPEETERRTHSCGRGNEAT